jgi:hypothetical protein
MIATGCPAVRMAAQAVPASLSMVVSAAMEAVTTPEAGPWPPPVEVAPLAPPPPPPRGTRWLRVGGFAVAVVLVFAVGWYGGVTYESHDAAAKPGLSFAGVQVQCDVLHDGTVVADGDHTLTVDTRGEEDATGASLDELSCILDHLAAPEAVRAHMEQTRALDGRQQDSWGTLTASWIYHPDTGMELIVRMA